MSERVTFIPGEIPVPKLFATMLGSIGPRPIAFASTVNEEGVPNLAPFSFFNGFGANPPILVFSPSRRGRDNTTKHTYDNVKKVPEVVINVVSYDMVQQVSLASSDFPEGVSEFEKVGLHAENSDLVKPPRVLESPVQYECRVNQVIETGDQGSAGNLVVCEVLKIHVRKDLLDDQGKIDQYKIDLVGRMGGDVYCRASGEALFEIEKPLTTVGIGVDHLPEHVRNSKVLTGNDLGQLGNLKSLPSEEELAEVRELNEVKLILESGSDCESMEMEIHNLARLMISEGDIYLALKLLLLV